MIFDDEELSVDEDSNDSDQFDDVDEEEGMLHGV
jgi:hypothetical protein